MRVMPPMMNIRRVTQWFSVLFVLMWMALIVQKAVHCTLDLSWQKQAKPQCHLGRAIGITELSGEFGEIMCIVMMLIRCVAADFVSDVVLVVLPLRLMWNLQLPTRQRRLLIALFSASMIITLISIVHAVFVIGPAGFLEAMSANIQVVACRKLAHLDSCPHHILSIQIAVSLMVCNLAVVVRFFYRFFGYDVSDDVPVFVTSDTIPGTSGGPGRRGAPIRLGNLRNDARVSTLRFWNDTNVDDAGMTQLTQSKAHSHLDSPGYRDERRDFERLELSFTPTKFASLEVPMDGQHKSGPITRATFPASPTEPQAR